MSREEVNLAGDWADDVMDWVELYRHPDWFKFAIRPRRAAQFIHFEPGMIIPYDIGEYPYG